MTLDPKAVEVAEWLREQCSRLKHGQCTTRRCIIRGGYSGRGGFDIRIATCEAKEAHEARAELDEARAQLATLREALNTIAGGFTDRFPGAPDVMAETPETFRDKMWGWSQKVARAARTDTAEAAEGWVKVPEGRIIVSLSAVVGAVKLGRDFYKDCGTSPCLYPDWLRELGVSVDNASDTALQAGEGSE